MMKFDLPFDLLEPWEEVAEEAEGLTVELKKELRSDSELFGEEVVPIAKRADCDDVLYLMVNSPPRVAVVHLTWSGRKASNKGWPSVSIFKDLEAWRTERMIPDYEDFIY